MHENEQHFRGGMADRGSRQRRLRTVDGHRVCGSPGCETVLSRYNTRQVCWQHDPGKRYVLRSPRGPAPDGPAPDVVPISRSA